MRFLLPDGPRDVRTERSLAESDWMQACATCCDDAEDESRQESDSSNGLRKPNHSSERLAARVRVHQLLLSSAPQEGTTLTESRQSELNWRNHDGPVEAAPIGTTEY
jgi:hypothetical protein